MKYFSETYNKIIIFLRLLLLAYFTAVFSTAQYSPSFLFFYFFCIYNIISIVLSFIFIFNKKILIIYILTFFDLLSAMIFTLFAPDINSYFAFSLPVLVSSITGIYSSAFITIFSFFAFICIKILILKQFTFNILEMINVLVFFVILFIISFIYNEINLFVKRHRSISELISLKPTKDSCCDFEKIIKLLQLIFEADSIAVYLFRDNKISLISCNDPEIKNFNADMSTSFIKETAVNGISHLINDSDKIEKDNVIPRTDLIRSVIIEPISNNGATVGVLLIANQILNFFKEDEKNFIKNLTNIIGPFFENYIPKLTTSTKNMDIKKVLPPKTEIKNKVELLMDIYPVISKTENEGTNNQKENILGNNNKDILKIKEYIEKNTGIIENLIKDINKINLIKLTPIEAINKIDNWQKMLK